MIDQLVPAGGSLGEICRRPVAIFIDGPKGFRCNAASPPRRAPSNSIELGVRAWVHHEQRFFDFTAPHQKRRAYIVKVRAVPEQMFGRLSCAVAKFTHIRLDLMCLVPLVACPDTPSDNRHYDLLEEVLVDALDGRRTTDVRQRGRDVYDV